MTLCASVVLVTLTWWHPTNSHASTQRGLAAYAKQAYAAAVNAFTTSHALRPTPASAFNLGTAQIASGRREEGSQTLGAAMKDPSLRADALYNRGNSALAASSYDYAIRDYSEALRLRPSDLQAKRNLEIALMRKQMAQKQSSSNQKQKQQGSSPNDQRSPQKQPSPQQNAQQQQPKGDPNAEALLRAVQQQEQEELQRMKRGRGDRTRIGW